MTRDYIPNPSEQPQRSMSRRWCCRCDAYTATKGGSFVPLFLCAKHKVKEKRDEN
jgi:hypothetical protein